MKRKLVKMICIVVIFATITVTCSLVLINSKWMQQRYGYGANVRETKAMLEEAYKRDAEGFDALVIALCRYNTSEQLLYEDHRLLQVLYDKNDLRYLPLDDQIAQAICDDMRNLADWNEVAITFETYGINSTDIQSVTFSIMVNTARVPWSKSYVEINMRCYLNGRPAIEDVWFSGGEWLSDRWVIVSYGLV